MSRTFELLIYEESFTNDTTVNASFMSSDWILMTLSIVAIMSLVEEFLGRLWTNDSSSLHKKSKEVNATANEKEYLTTTMIYSIDAIGC